MLSIDCEAHGKGTAATVCCHLPHYKRAPLGFIENSSEPGDLQGWCYACEHMFSLEGEMTEKFKEFCSFVLVCEECYSAIRRNHGSTT